MPSPSHSLPVARGWNFACTLSLVGAAYFLWRLVQATYDISALSPVPVSHFGEHPKSLAEYYENSDTFQYGFLAFGIIALIFFVVPRRHRGGDWIYVALVVALSTLALGFATYLPCAPHGNPVVPTVGWVLGIFEGDIELAGPGARCALAFSPGFELARGLAVILVAWALTYALRIIARRGLDRWRARAARDVDVVVGLDDSTVPLIEALVAERDERAQQDSWINRRPGFLARPRVGKPPGVSLWQYGVWWGTGVRRGDLRRGLNGPTTIVVIDAGGTGLHGADLRAKGVRVLDGDATRAEALEHYIVDWRFSRRPGVALRRLYAVTPDQQTNLRIFAAATKVLGKDLSGHVHGLVPRLYVRLDDEREARLWRLEHLQSRRDGAATGGRESPEVKYIADALTSDRGAAGAIADRIVLPDSGQPYPVDRLLVVGDSGLVFALLEEIAWRQWCAWEMGESPSGPGEVLLLGANARARAREWHEIRAPWRAPAWSRKPGGGPQLFRVADPSSMEEPWQEWETAWEHVAFRHLTESDPTSVVFVEGRPDYEAAAARLASAFPSNRPRVMLASGAPTSWHEQVTSTGVVRVARALTASDRDGRKVVPPDSVERLARQQHMSYLKAQRTAPSDATRVLTQCPWDQLPQFFRQDNIRQHWLMLNGFGETDGPGWQWVPVASDEAQGSSPEMPPQLAAAIKSTAESEWRDWNAMRRRNGWWHAETKEDRSDPLRLSAHVRDPRSRASVPAPDEELVQAIVERLWAMGLTPVKASEGDGVGHPDPVPLT